jgi:hypothetical protein
MSTGRDCHFYEQKHGEWIYKLEANFDEYETYGPFPPYKAAKEHLSKNHPNPGGWGVSPLKCCEKTYDS